MPDSTNVSKQDGESIKDLLREQTFELKAVNLKLLHIETSIDRFNDWKTGGPNPANGIDVRLDRQERSMSALAKVAWLSLSTGIGLLITRIWNAIEHKV